MLMPNPARSVNCLNLPRLGRKWSEKVVKFGALQRKYYSVGYGIVRQLLALGHPFHVGDGWTVQAKSAVGAPL
jgi:hypothetical protein